MSLPVSYNGVLCCFRVRSCIHSVLLRGACLPRVNTSFELHARAVCVEYSPCVVRFFFMKRHASTIALCPLSTQLMGEAEACSHGVNTRFALRVLVFAPCHHSLDLRVLEWFVLLQTRAVEDYAIWKCFESSCLTNIVAACSLARVE